MPIYFKKVVMKTNILEVVNDFGIGGTERTMQVYCKYLDKNKFKVYACGFFYGGPREKFIRKYTSNMLIANGSSNKVINFIKNHNIQILHYHGISRNDKRKGSVEKVLSYCKKNGIKTIETSPFSLFENKIDSLLDIRIFVSKASLLKFFWKYKNEQKKSKYLYLYNPIDLKDLKKYYLGEKERKLLREKMGVGEGEFVIGKVGRADFWKWSDEIIDVVPILLKSIPNLKIVIRALPKQKMSKIKKLGIYKYFILLPETSSEKEIAETYQMMDVMLHTSRIGECNSVAINEAMYFGLPVITNSTDFMQFTVFDRDNGQVEIVRNKENGYVENSLKRMASRIIFLKDNPGFRKKIGFSSKKKVNDFFDAKKVIKKFEELIAEKNTLTDLGRIGDEYNELRIKNTFFDLIKINIRALIDFSYYVKFKKVNYSLEDYSKN